MREPIKDYPGYEIDEAGTVWSLKGKTPKMLIPSKHPRGYRTVGLRKDNKTHTVWVHRLVLETFVGVRPTGFECRHLNGDRSDNRLDNLTWGTPSSNQNDRVMHGTSNRNRQVKLSVDDVADIKLLRTLGHTCTSIADRYGVSHQHISDITRGKERIYV